jgi:hypothetical protein
MLEWRKKGSSEKVKNEQPENKIKKKKNLWPPSSSSSKSGKKTQKKIRKKTHKKDKQDKYKDSNRKKKKIQLKKSVCHPVQMLEWRKKGSSEKVQK